MAKLAKVDKIGKMARLAKMSEMSKDAKVVQIARIAKMQKWPKWKPLIKLSYCQNDHVGEKSRKVQEGENNRICQFDYNGQKGKTDQKRQTVQIDKNCKFFQTRPNDQIGQIC